MRMPGTWNTRAGILEAPLGNVNPRGAWLGESEASGFPAGFLV
jgi:hypothetical protein